MNFAQILFGFSGRIRRTTYWLAHLGTIVALSVVAFVLLLIAGGVGIAAGSASNGGDVSDAAAGAIAAMSLLWLAPVYIVAVWIGLALGIKRCHDRDYPGAMILIALIPILGGLWALIDLGFIDGTQGPNRFGPSPKGFVAPSVQAPLNA